MNNPVERRISSTANTRRRTDMMVNSIVKQMNALVSLVASNANEYSRPDLVRMGDFINQKHARLQAALGNIEDNDVFSLDGPVFPVSLQPGYGMIIRGGKISDDEPVDDTSDVEPQEEQPRRRRKAIGRSLETGEPVFDDQQVVKEGSNYKSGTSSDEDTSVSRFMGDEE